MKDQGRRESEIYLERRHLRHLLKKKAKDACYLQFLARAAQFGLGVSELHCQMLALLFREYWKLGGPLRAGETHSNELLGLEVISLLGQFQDQLTITKIRNQKTANDSLT